MIQRVYLYLHQTPHSRIFLFTRWLLELVMEVDYNKQAMIGGMVGSILLIAVGLFDLIERYKDIETIGVSSLIFWFSIYMYNSKK